MATQRPPKSASSIIDAIAPEPDYNDAHDGRFIGHWNPEYGVLTITFTRSDPGLTPDQCDEYDVPDAGDGSAQLVEREALIKALVELFSKPVAIRYSDPESWRKALAKVLFP